MSTQKNRINTIITLLNGNPAFTPNLLSKLTVEFHEAIKVNRVKTPKRKYILKILHSTRAVDSSLKGFLDHHGIRGGAHSMGQYLHRLERHANTSPGRISAAERTNYQRTIVDVRNEHLHQADSYPRNEVEVYDVICEMQALLTRVMSL